MIQRILPVVLLIISLGLFFGYINPTYSGKVVKLQNEIKQYNATLAAAQDFNRKEAQLAEDRNAIPADSIAHLESFLPDGVDNVQLIVDMNALAARSGIQLSNFDIRGNTGDQTGPGMATTQDQSNDSLPLASGPKKVDSLDLTVKAVGTYSAFRTFLGGVEKSLRPMDLVQMQLANSTSGVYTYDITFRIYWLH